MKRLRIKPQECMVIEDSGSGILAGKAAGATVIAVPNEHLMPSPEALQSADIVIDSLASLSTTLNKLQQR
jgi:beta-phosphoglucomutase-like phosphatase (HAD superfamily)